MAPHWNWFYDVWNALLRCAVYPASRPRYLNIQATGRDGAWLLVSNHISHFDPPLISAASRRRIDWMAMEEMFRLRFLAALLRRVGAFPVDRFKPDRAALRTALERLRKGNVVGIFPEGGIRAGETSVLEGAESRGGAALLAVMARVPILPCVILGSDRLYRPANWLPFFFRAPVWIGFGERIEPDQSLPRDKARAKAEEDMRRAFEEIQQRLVEHFDIQPRDLPKTPQSRKGGE